MNEGAMREEKRQTVLIVDDTEENIDILLETLDSDYEVRVALNGVEALESVEEEIPDIILLDIMMPAMDGYEVCAKLKTQEKTRDIPVIFITALSEAGNETMGLEQGAIDYITKPFTPSIVKARVKNHLELRQAVKLREDVERILHHDLKNPLQTVLGLPRILLMISKNLDESQTDMLERIEAAGKTMLQMINNSLDMFKIEQGYYKLNPEDVDLAPYVRDCNREFEVIRNAMDITLSLKINDQMDDGNLPFIVRGERLLLYSMLANLIRNALEASPRGGNVEVELRHKEGKEISISNKGVIPREMRDRFFQKYATHGKASGTGLGTYSARLIAEVHGGSIGFDTSDESGMTTIQVHIP